MEHFKQIDQSKGSICPLLLWQKKPYNIHKQKQTNKEYKLSVCFMVLFMNTKLVCFSNCWPIAEITNDLWVVMIVHWYRNICPFTSDIWNSETESDSNLSQELQLCFVSLVHPSEALLSSNAQNCDICWADECNLYAAWLNEGGNFLSSILATKG